MIVRLEYAQTTSLKALGLGKGMAVAVFCFLESLSSTNC